LNRIPLWDALTTQRLRGNAIFRPCSGCDTARDGPEDTPEGTASVLTMSKVKSEDTLRAYWVDYQWNQYDGVATGELPLGPWVEEIPVKLDLLVCIG